MPVMSLGIRSGVNWMRVEIERERLRQRVHHQRLRQPGHALQDAVSAGEDGHQQLLDDIVLADDLPGHLLADLIVGRSQLFQFGQIESHRSSVAVLKIASPSSTRWKIGRNLNGSCKMITAMAVP